MKMSIGGNQRQRIRQPNDLYPTPVMATLTLLKHQQLSKHVWEPACGLMDISNVLVEHGHIVKSTDISLGDDIFASHHNEFDGDIVTNPPYSLSLKFVERCLELAGTHNVCMLMPIGFMTGKARRPLLLSGKLKTVIIITTRLKIRCGDEIINSQFNHAWYVFSNIVNKNRRPEIIFE